MSSKAVKISIMLLSLLALAVPSPTKSAAGETPPAGAFVSTEVSPASLHIGETASVSVKLNNVPVEGYKSVEFTCTYDGTLIEKSNIAVTDLFGPEPVVAIHDPQNDTFILAIAGTNSNRAMTSGTAFTFSAKGLQAGQSAVQCTTRVSKGDNLAIDVPSIGAHLTILEAGVSPTPFLPATPGGHEHPTAVSTALESPTPLPTGSLSGQFLASKPVTVRLWDANQVEITSVFANPDGTFVMTPPPGDYILVATASGFLSYQGSLTITAGNPAVFPAASLLAGDVDGNNVIDQFDALTIGMSYTSSTPEAADLNNDAVINFLDLELLAENYRQTGPTTGSPSILALLQKIKPTAISSPIPGPIKTVIAPIASGSPIPGHTKTVIAPAPTSSPAPGPKETVIAPTAARGPTIAGAAYPDAPLCPTHEPTKWHGLWDSAQGCHYDHEHGTSPFTPEVAAAFPGFDLFALLGNVGVGHTNLSSPMENTHKHGGFKWNVQLHHPETCAGFEGATTGVDGSVIQYHGFGDYAIEAEVHIHSTVALLRQCQTGNPTDYGYIFVNQLQDYGQRITPYQGMILPYPNQPVPPFPSGGGPYLSFNCVDLVEPYDMHCRAGLGQAQRNNADTNWTSKPTAGGHSDSSPIFRLFWRAHDTYKEIRVDNFPSAAYPFEFLWLCSADNGATYNPAGCRYNNTTTQVHEVGGVIPVEWDNLAGWDSNPAAGRVTAEGFVTKFGIINPTCTGPATEMDCFPIKMVNAFTGSYGSVLVFTEGKGTNIVPITPERDIYFCAGVPCSETSAGAVPSGWIGPEN
jgi:hypothetical protein